MDEKFLPRQQYVRQLSTVDGNDVFVIPEDHKITDLNSFKVKNSSWVTADTLEAVKQYLEYFDEGNRVVFVRGGKVLACLDFHEPTTPKSSWSHIEYNSEADPLCEQIVNSQNVRMTQKMFANFWRDSLDAILEPEGTEVLRQLQQIKAIAVNESNHETTGQNTRRQETFNIEIDLLNEFMIGIKPYRDLKIVVKTPVRVDAELESGKLLISYKLPKL